MNVNPPFFLSRLYDYDDDGGNVFHGCREKSSPYRRQLWIFYWRDQTWAFCSLRRVTRILYMCENDAIKALPHQDIHNTRI